MITLSNNVLQIEVALKGAELQSIYNKPNQLEYLWNGNPDFWSKRSPVLFPIVGGLKNGEYAHDGKEFKLGRHGFARDMEFELSEQTDNSICLSLHSNEQTLQLFPFNFIFSVTYTLNNNEVEIGYKVENLESSTLFFSVGAHPAFKVPIEDGLQYEDYYLLFNKSEQASKYPLSAEGLTEMTPEHFFDHTNKLPLEKSLFAKDALVFKELSSTQISIVSDKSTHGVQVSFEGFPYMGIWAAKGADFVCIEPWDGIADNVNATGELKDKEGILQLEPGTNYHKSFTVRIY